MPGGVFCVLGRSYLPSISGVDPDRPLALSDNNGRSWATKRKSIKPHQLQASALDLSDVRGRGPDELADLMPLKDSRANFSVKKSTNARTSSLRNICPDVKGMRNPLLLLSRVRQMRTVDRLDTRNAAPCRTVQAYLARKVLKEHPDAREPSHVGNIGL